MDSCFCLFCKVAKCAFKTSTNGLADPKVFSSLGMSALSKSISEIIDILLIAIINTSLRVLIMTMLVSAKFNFLSQNSKLNAIRNDST